MSSVTNDLLKRTKMVTCENELAGVSSRDKGAVYANQEMSVTWNKIEGGEEAARTKGDRMIR